MEDIEKLIIAAESLAFEGKRIDSSYSKVWFGATETIKDYLELLKWDEVQKILTVCSSGDHILNLVNKSVKKIDTFDSNPLTFPYANLKMAFLKAFSYEDFFRYFEKLSIASRNEKEEYEIFSIVKPFIQKPYDYFWETLYRENTLQNKHSRMETSLLEKLCTYYIPEQANKLRNQYLSSEEEYEKTRQNLKESKINFQCTDLFDMPQFFSGGYDKILLSNISDYITNTDNKTFHSFIVNELAPLLNVNGEILAAYVYHYMEDGEMRGIHFRSSWDGNYSVFENNYDLLKVSHIDDCGHIECGSKDAVLVYSKQK